jgi:hypothetical protein
MTNKWQPLDERIFSPVNSTTRSEYHRFPSDHPAEMISTLDAARMIVDSWQKLSITTMEAACTVYANGDGEDEGDGEGDEWSLYDFDAVAGGGEEVDSP